MAARRTIAALASAATLLVVAAGAQAETWTQQGPRIASPSTHQGYFGTAVALSGDGTTAVVGARSDGAAWVLTRSGSTWTQLAELTSAEASGEGEFGDAVALSGNGRTALVGAPGDDEGRGAVFVFRRHGSTWTQVGAKLVEPEATEDSRFGRSVALADNGGTALVGASYAAWVFRRAGGGFAGAAAKLVAGEESGACNCGAGFGTSVALSGDGRTAFVGASEPAAEEVFHSKPAAWVYARKGKRWKQQGEPLIGGGESVALSGDGTTALTGDGFHALVYERSGSTWTQTATLEGSDKDIGCACLKSPPPALALSADGSTALLGQHADGAETAGGGRMPGAAWAFTRSGEGAWTQEGGKMRPRDATTDPQFGAAAALSADGSIALIGGPADETYVGAVWEFAA